MQKQIPVLAVVFFVICVAFTYAQPAPQEYEIDSLIVFPDSITSDSWQNIETLNEQNMNESSLYQQFSKTNSAYLPNYRDTENVKDTARNTSNDALETTSETRDKDGIETESLEETEPVPPPVESSGTASTTVFRRVSDAFRLVYTNAIEYLPFVANSSTTVIEETDGLTTDSADTSEIVANEPESETNETSIQESEPTTTPEVVETNSDIVEPPEVETDGSLVEGVSTSTTPLIDSPTATTSETDQTTNGGVTESTESGEVTTEAYSEAHSIVFKDFAVPLEPDTELTGGQLRMSFAAKEKERFSNEGHNITINYSFDNGESWQSGGFVAIEDEVSNSINGGYFLFALPEITDIAQLDSMMIEIHYIGDSTLLDGIYLDSVWLELFISKEIEQVATSTPFVLPDSGYQNDLLRGDTLTLPDGSAVEFSFTDDNIDETLIIKSDRHTYAGLTEAEVYFNVTNTSGQSDTFTLQSHFEEEAGKMISLEEWEQNKQFELVVPEYRPYIYHCAAGWEEVEPPLVEDFSDFSELSEEPAIEVGTGSATSTDTTEEEAGTGSTTVNGVEEIATTSVDLFPETVIENIETGLIESTTTESLDIFPMATSSELISASETEILSFSSTETSEVDPDTIELNDDLSNDDALEYVCGESSVVRTCDALEGDDTSCRVDNKKVADHRVEQFRSGWEPGIVATGTPEDNRGLLRKTFDFLGFGVERKDVPETFADTYHAADTYTIQAGETKYFKMTIGFDPMSEGEFWIEAVGESEVYGLLDPFWSSEWTYRVPITIDNSSGTEDLIEHQVYLQLENASSTFWTNVNSDGSDVRFISESLGSGDWYGNALLSSDWYNFDWSSRTEITVEAAEVDSNLTDFPVYVDLADLGSDFFSNVESDGADIRITTGDGQTELPFELVSINTGGGTGELHFRADTLSSTVDSTFYVYFENTGATAYAANDTFGSENVWTNGYEAVYHFADTPTGSSGDITDSTGNNNGTSQGGMSGSDIASGRMGGGYDFGGGAGYEVTLPDVVGGNTAVTVSYWINNPSYDDGRAFSSGNDGSNMLSWPDNDAGGAFDCAINGTGNRAAGTIPGLSGWVNHTCTWDGSNIFSYVNATEDGTDTLSGGTINTDGENRFGNDDGGQPLTDVADELRIMNVGASPTWISTEYNNQSSAGTFYSTSTRETAPVIIESGTWQRRIPITIAASEVSGDLTDFPVYVDLATLGNSFFDLVQDDGDDIRITTDDGLTLQPLELVSIDSSSETGELYFRADTISSSVDTTFYIYYNNGDATGFGSTETFGSENVWTNNFEAVLHFEESPGGSSPQFADSTGNGHNATADLMDSGNQVNGRFGNGVDADGSTESVIAPGFTNLGTSNQSYAMGIWFNADIGETDGNVIGMSLESPPNAWRIPPLALNADRLDAISWPGQSTAAGVTSITQGDWYQGYTSWSSAIGLDLYLNGSNEDNNAQGTFSASGGSNFLHIAGDVTGGAGDEGHFNGQIDELRVFNDTLSADWISAEFSNMDTPATFYATGTTETFVSNVHNELDFWIQYWDESSNIADVWVQVDRIPAGTSTTIYLYYGNSTAQSTSDEYATFSYETPQELYYTVTTNGSSLDIFSLVDDNLVSIDGTSTTTLDRGETISFATFTETSVIRATGPLSPKIDSDDAMVPISFASTTFAAPSTRGNEIFHMYAPFATAAYDIFDGVTSEANGSIPLGTQVSESGSNVGSGGIVESDESILVYEERGNDYHVLYPATTEDLYGIHSGSNYIGATQDNTDFDLACSSGASTSVTGLSRGTVHENVTCGGGGDGNGDAVRVFNITDPSGAIQQGDGDGNETSMFLPASEFGTEYYFPSDAAYATVACPPKGGSINIAVYDLVGAQVDSGTCTPSGIYPGVLYFDGGNGGDTTAYTAGYLIASTDTPRRPFYVYYDDNEIPGGGDENNVWGSVQGKKFTDSSVSRTFGDQEVNTDAQFEQLSFLWYENGNSYTPTSTWPINDVGGRVSEGEAITGQGALNPGDVLRLRVSLAANVATSIPAYLTTFKLQYANAGSGQCDAIQDSDWYDVGNSGSTTAAFTGYNNTSLNDGVELSSTTLASSTVFGTYEEENNTAITPNVINPGDAAEWDWTLEGVNFESNSSYCFRMVRGSGAALATYTLYPRLETSGPPLAPTPSVYFDNERTAAFDSVLEFTASDITLDDLHYQVQIDDDHDFNSIAVTRESEAQFSEFENILDGSDKSPFNSGAPIRFTSPTTLLASTTYWWRVRARDPLGSNSYGEWSEPFSFTTDGSVDVSEWHQTTGDQFSTNELTSLATSSGAVSVSGSVGVMVGTSIDFDDATVGNAWGRFLWEDTETSGTILYQVEYLNGSTWTLVPDGEIANNSVGNGTSPINLLGLDPDIYNQIRLVANFSGTTLSIEEWTVEWGQRVNTPTLDGPFDNEKSATTTPELSFLTTDPQGDDLEYEVTWSTDNTFVTGSTTVNSSTTPGFENLTTPADTDPYTSGDTIGYTLTPAQELTNGLTYWWRVRARDPEGGNAFSPWSDPYSFTVDTTVAVSTWFQTTDEQFETGTLIRTEGSGDSVTFSDAPGKIAVYREITAGDAITTSVFDHNWDTTVREDDIYSLSGSTDIQLESGYYAVLYGARFDETSGSNRSEIQSYLSVDGTDQPIGWSQGYLRRSDGADEAFTSGGGIVLVEDDNDVLVLHSQRTDANGGGVARAGNTAGIQLLRLDNSWDYLRLGKDSSQTGPVTTTWTDITYDRQDEVDSDSFEHTVGSADITLKTTGHYLVFANTYGAIDDADDRSVVTQKLTLDGSDIGGSYVSLYMRGNNNGNDIHEGATAIGMIIETTETNQVLNIELTRNEGTGAFTINEDEFDSYVDRTGVTIVKLPDADFVRLTDSGTDDMNPASLTAMGWDTELEADVSFTANDTLIEVNVDDDYLFLTALYGQDIGGNARKYYNQGWRINSGALLPYGQAGKYDRESGSANDAGSFSGVIFSGLSDDDEIEVVTQAIANSGTMAADQKSVQGLRIGSLAEADIRPVTIESTDIDFSKGTGPKWEAFSWNETTPGASTILYQVLYQTGPDTYALIPDIDLPGNSTGTTSSPIDLSNLDVQVYDILRVRATLTCDGVDCPSIEDWSVEWSEGVNMTGTLQGYDRTTNVNSGTVRAAVNGVLLPSMGSVTNGTWSINNVTAFADDVVTVFVDGAADTDEANAVLVYDGAGDITGVELFERHLSLSANENATTTNVLLSAYDNSISGDEDIFFDVTPANTLEVCDAALSGCDQNNLYVGTGNVYVPDTSGSGNIETHDFINDGRTELDGNTMRVNGSWENNSLFFSDTSTVIFTAVSSIGDASTWYDQSWGYRIPITIQSTQVDDDLSNFPVYVDLSQFDDSFFSNLNDDGGDIRVTESDGVNEIAREVVFASTTLESGELHFNATTISSTTNTTFYLYHGNATATDYAIDDTFGAENTWNSGYEAVYHLSESGSTYLDSTDHDNDGTGEATDPTLTPGQLGDGQDFVSGRIDLGTGMNTAINSSQEYLLSAWVNLDTSTGDQSPVSQATIIFWADEGGTGDGFCHHNGGYMPTDCENQNDQDPGNWQLVVARYDGANGYVYVDGAPTGAGAAPRPFAINLGSPFAIGSQDGSGGRVFNGQIDEVRITSSDFGEDWLESEFINQSSQSTFFATSTPESYLSVITNIETLDDADGTLDFYNLTFGETSGTATWMSQDPLDVNGNLSVSFGTLDRTLSTINVAGNLTTAADGFWTGIATTTFDGSGNRQWIDSNASKQNIGYAVVDGSARTVTIQSDVLASTVTIGANDTLDAGGANTISVIGDFKNNNVFTPRTSIVDIIATNTSVFITPGSSSFYSLTFSGSGTASAFSTAIVTVLNDFTIATGTVAMPTTRLSVGGSFDSAGGIFMHNNGAVRFTGSGVETVAASGTPFFNAFYDLSFTGSGDWTMLDQSATTSHNFTISNGDVVLPAEVLTVGGDYTVSGSGAFAHNDGEVVFLISEPDTIESNGSSFNDTRFRAGGVSSTWYDVDWEYRVPIVVGSSGVVDDMTDFPVYVDLGDIGSQFFNNINNDGGDIRMTESDGVTEIAREVVFASTTAEIGELYFLADTLSSTTSQTFYIYYGNTGASDYATDDTYGAENVWVNGFEGVLHMQEDPGGSAPQMIDSTGNGHDGTAFSLVSGNSLPGQFGQSVDHDGGTADRVRGSGFTSLGTVNQPYSISAWFNADTGETDGAIIHVSGADNGGGWCLPMLSIASDNVRAISWVGSQVTAQGTTGVVQGDWNQAYTTWDPANGLEVYLNGSFENSTAQATFSASGGSNYIHTGFDPPGCGGDNGGLNGRVDEVRIYNERKDADWIATEYNNQSTTTDFYSVGSLGSGPSRIFADTNTSVLGNVIIESGTVTFPTGALSIGGSFDNNDTFDHSNGTVRFDSTSGSETIAVGNSLFATVDFNSVTGDWTILESATATTAFVLTNVNDFTLNSGLLFDVLGTFTNEANGASTTWTGSTLRLSSDTDYTVNTKTSTGDSYATLLLTDDTDVGFWNSDATTYTTLSSSSIYSQDHAGNDGDLYIFGDYLRTTGTEYWSYATDFDGVSLGTTSARVVDVRVANGASVTASSSTFEITGVSGASTTIDAQSGSFSLTTHDASVFAEYFEMTGTDADGFNLTSSSTVTQFDNALFTIGTGFSAVTVDASTIDTSPAAQFFNTNFVTGGGDDNVTLNGTPSSYWWFREGGGDRYGEAFDINDGNPGSIRWDDSSFTVALSGTVYADDGETPLGAPTCDGVNENVRVVVDGGAFASSTPCNGADGSYAFSSISYNGDPSIVVYLDTDGGEQGSTISRTPTVDITDFDIYANRVMTRHEDTAPMTIAKMTGYDENDDSDLRFVAATGSPDTLIVRSNTELMVASSTTFIPGGTLTLQSGGAGTVYDGSFHIDDNATFVASSTETHTIGGSFFFDTGGIFTSASSTFIFTSTTTGRTITGSSTIIFHDLDFTGIGGGWNLNTDLTIDENIEVATGTLTGTGSVIIPSGSFTGDGLVSLGGGTVTLEETSTLGGSQGWTFNNLTLGNGSVVGTTTPASVATTSVDGVFTISTGHYLDAGNSNWDLGGSGTVFVEDGTFLEDISTVRYSGATGSNILSTTYYNLDLNASAGTPTYTAAGLGIIVTNDLTVGGVDATTVTFDTSDPVLDVNGDMLVRGNGTLIGSNSAQFTVGGSWDNDGIYMGSGGTVTFDGNGVHTIAAGASSFSSVTASGTGDFTITENATATDAFALTAADDFTVGSGVALAVGGVFTNELGGTNTVWTDSVLHLYGGGDYEVNGKDINDTYSTLVVGPGTEIRLWNSDAATTIVNTTGSLYSMNHADVPGDLYIFGAYTNESRSDYWSYATDFDGTSLLGGSERQVDVYFASSSTGVWTGGGITIVGTSTASTTLQNQGVGTYGLQVAGTASMNWQRVVVRDINASGTVVSGTPTVSSIVYTDLMVEIDDATAMTVSGTAITANPAKNFTGGIFNSDSGVTGAVNVTTTGTTISAWRFTGNSGNLWGESFDADPDAGGDPGYIIWDDSAAILAISGNVYQSDRSTVSNACDDVTTNIFLVIDGSTVQNASSTCSSSDGSFSISNISFSASDVLTLFINGESEKGVNVTVDPISSISDMNIYENHVIVRHENTDPLSIVDMAVYDSSDDGDIPFTAVDGVSDTLTVPSDTQLLVWDAKEFEPQGDVTVLGGGGGASYDGTLELLTNSTWTSNSDEDHFIGGNITFGSGANLDANTSTFTLTSSEVGQTIDVNEDSFYDLTFNGLGSWTVTDSVLITENNLTITSGAVTLPSGTTTVGGSFDNTGGTFDASDGILYFTSTSGGNSIETGDSDIATLRFNGFGGAWAFTDTDATTTGTTTIDAGSVTLPSGIFSVEGDFIASGTVTHNSGTLRLTDNAGVTSLTLNGNDLYSVTSADASTVLLTDGSAAFLGDLEIEAGSFIMATNTLAIGGSLDASGGTFTHSSGTVLFNSADTGENVNPGSNVFYNVQFGSAGGGWTLQSATATNNFALTAANTFEVPSGETLSVSNIFTNLVGGGATTWTGTTLRLLSGTNYTVNTRTQGGDNYETLYIAPDTDIRSWDSSATTTQVATSSSFYSQDHAGSYGALYIFGDYHRATGTDYWSYTTDFDGTAIGGGGERAVTVSIVDGATTTVENTGNLQIVGDSLGTTTIQNQGSGTYTFNVTGGTLNAQYYAFRDLAASGLTFTGVPTITSLSNGDFELAVDSGILITVSRTTINANASKIISGTRFATTTAITGTNILLTGGTTTNAWTFVNHRGNLDGELYDIDGATDCGSLRWDDSSCLLSQQTHYRWRNDDGGEGAPDSEWYNMSWDKRKRIRLENDDSSTYTDAAIKFAITYDTDMQPDFEDLRFTDDTGLTLLSYWIEDYTTSAEATVWVKVPTLTGNDTTPIYMYYDNLSATSTGSSTEVFIVADDFEDGDILEYSGNTGHFDVGSTFAFGGTFGLDATPNQGAKAPDGISRSDLTVSQGEIIRYMQYIDTGAGAGDEVCTLFGVQEPVTNNNNYAVCIELFGVDRISLVRNAENTETSADQILASSTVSYATGWYEVEIDWRTNDDIEVTLYNDAGSAVANILGNDSAYTSGTIGFTFWGQHGGWDSYVSRPRIDNEPTVYVGAEQTDGGATWSEVIDTPSNSFEVGDTARLRVAIENSGLAITSQLFELHYAAKGSELNCESVDYGDYSEVPNQASCGSSPVCMQTSSNLVNGEVTSDHLTDVNGVYIPGSVVESPSNQTSSFDLGQGSYTELEYVITPTVNASDSYCFRVTNDGSDLDSYTSVPEIQVSFTPVISAFSLNQGQDISLFQGATSTIYATGTVSDQNGYADLGIATATIFRNGPTGVGESCSSDDNNCYRTVSPMCSLSGCSGNSCEISCAVDIWFFAEPTDVGTYAADAWTAYLELSDQGGATTTASSPSVDLLTTRALTVDSAIDYGTLVPNSNTESYNATTTLQNIGNDGIDVMLEGTDLFGSSSVIPVNEQIFATSTFNYGACVVCSQLSSTTPINLEVDLDKPTTTAPGVTDDVYWGIEIPFGVGGAHQGINTFYVTGD